MFLQLSKTQIWTVQEQSAQSPAQQSLDWCCHVELSRSNCTDRMRTFSSKCNTGVWARCRSISRTKRRLDRQHQLMRYSCTCTHFVKTKHSYRHHFLPAVDDSAYVRGHAAARRIAQQERCTLSHFLLSFVRVSVALFAILVAPQMRMQLRAGPNLLMVYFVKPTSRNDGEGEPRCVDGRTFGCIFRNVPAISCGCRQT